MRKLTIINQQYPPEVAATGQIFRTIAEYMCAEGWEVTVVAGRPFYPGMTSRPPKRETARGVTVRRLFNTTFPKRSFAGKLLNLLSFEISLFFYCLFRISRKETVLVATAPPMAVLCAAVGRFFRRYRVVMTVQDLYPDALAASGMSSPDKLSYRMLQWLMRRSMRACRRVFTISEDMRAHLEDAYRLQDVRLIPNLFPEEIRPIDNGPAKAARGFSGKLVVQYSGNFGVAHEAETLLCAAKALAGDEGIVFQIAGAGKNYDVLREKCEAEALPNIVFEGYAPADRLEAHLGLADLSIVVFNAPFRNVLLPSKYYGILASGRGVLLISGCESDISRDIARCGMGVQVDHGEGARLAEALRGLASSPARVREMGERARALYEAQYAPEKILAAYASLLSEV